MIDLDARGHGRTTVATLLLATWLGCGPGAGTDGDGDEAGTASAPGETAAGVPSLSALLESARLVDLTYPFGEETVYWPTAPHGFRLDTLSHGETSGGWFYSAFTFSAPEHGGTHLDAPVHFARGARATHDVPLRRLIGPAAVIDVSGKAAENPDYRLSPDDVRAFETGHGRIEPGAIVLLRTGWGDRWPDPSRYLGGSAPGDASNLHFPSYGAEAARLLVEDRQVAALGADVASLDPGDSREFPVHRILSERNVPGFENLARLAELPPRGAVLLALPMKIRGGSGAPLRAVAVVPDTREEDG